MIITQLKEKFTFNCSKGETVIRILHAMLLFLTEYDVILHHTARIVPVREIGGAISEAR